jgi:protein gp37
MAENSKIEWCDHTANFWWGCTKISDGCKNCYADTLSRRYGKAIWGPDADREMKIGVWSEVARWQKEAAAAGVRKRVFCQSMADFFEGPETAQNPDAYAKVVEARDKVLCEVIPDTPNLDWLILTKRPANIEKMIPFHWCSQFPENVWIGTSVEDQKTADKRIPELLKVPAVVRFLSCEPLLSQVCLEDEWLYPRFATDDPRYHRPDGRGVDWVIIGGESGPGARPFDIHWAKTLVRQCGEVGVACFVKQLGANPVRRSRFSEDIAGSPESNRIKLVDRKGGEIAEFPDDLQVREFPR